VKRIKKFNEALTDKMTPKSDEEISSALKKLHDDYKFITKVNDYHIEYHMLNDVKDIEYIEINDCKVYWDYELNTASWGINYILPKISKITLTAKIFIYNKEKDLDKSFKREFLYDIMNSDIYTESENNNQIMPYSPTFISLSHLEIDSDKKPLINIIF
jgi:hypothetical protein